MSDNQPDGGRHSAPPPPTSPLPTANHNTQHNGHHGHDSTTTNNTNPALMRSKSDANDAHSKPPLNHRNTWNGHNHTVITNAFSNSRDSDHEVVSQVTGPTPTDQITTGIISANNSSSESLNNSLNSSSGARQLISARNGVESSSAVKVNSPRGSHSGPLKAGLVKGGYKMAPVTRVSVDSTNLISDQGLPSINRRIILYWP